MTRNGIKAPMTVGSAQGQTFSMGQQDVDQTIADDAPRGPSTHREMGAMMRMVSTGRRMNLTTEGTTLLTNRSTYGSTSVIRKMGMTEEE